ncbi:hypothetical protein PRZ48_002119 [Zasmidium cellare]|uniref:F-box domain-containing protein n=1 Tax=Zasmidium cellare TaxID=395010 RepID=A0ABR0F352_ZASCE|nr:hypothetical protein PRZ48_002119 [Zasmidium cellare]
MERLPEELIVQICEFCDHASLKNARLVDSRWNAASTPATFEHFYMGVFGSGVEKLGNLAESPLSKHVKTFTIYSEVLPNWSKTAWQKAIDFRPPFSQWLPPVKVEVARELATLNWAQFSSQQSLREYNLAEKYESLPRHSFNDDDLERGFSRYQECVRDQANWRKQVRYLAFKEYFARLPNLIEARVECTTPFVGRTNQWPVWRALRRHILVGPDDWMYSTDFQDENYSYLSGHAAMSLLEAVAYRASFSGTKQLTSLYVHSSHVAPYHDLMEEAFGRFQWFAPRNSYIHQLQEAFRHLTRIYLHVPHATISDRLEPGAVAKETMTFLRQARQVQSLDLRYGDDELSPDDDASQLEVLFLDGSENVLWPDIKHLALATNIPAEILVGFLRNHSKTLESLELRDMLVRNVDLALAQIPKVVELRHVYVEQLWDDNAEDTGTSVHHLCVLSRGTDFDDPYEQAVKSYLLGQKSMLPVIERDGGFGDVVDWEEEDDPP